MVHGGGAAGRTVKRDDGSADRILRLGLLRLVREGCGRQALGLVAGSLRGSRLVSLGLPSAYVCS